MKIEERVELLERELRHANRRNLRVWGLVLCLGLGAIAWAIGVPSLIASPNSDPARLIRARGFVLEDEEGRDRAALEFSRAGSPSLRLIDLKGESRLFLFLGQDDMPQLALCDAKGKDRAMLSLAGDGQPLFFLSDENVARASLSLGRFGPGLYLNDAKGKTSSVFGGRAVFGTSAELGLPPMTWYSVKQSVYHDNLDCSEGNNIEPENLRPGTHGFRLCTHCAALNAKRD